MAAQLPDWIIIDGEFRDLYSNPLELYWTRLNKKRPLFYPLSNCARGYIATWEMIDNELYLVGIDGNYERRSVFLVRKSTRFTLKTLLPDNKGQPVKATWYSGKLRVPEGRMTMYQHHEYDSRFEKEVIMTISAGVMTKMVTLDYAHKTLTLNSEVLVSARREFQEE